MSQAKLSDEELYKVLNSDLDSLLIFVSCLFFLLECKHINKAAGGSVLGHPFGFPNRSP
jgi:hypothetical protein